MSQRFFLETPLGEATTATLLDSEAQHVVKVMRARMGDEIVAFDGSGWEFVARIVKLGKASVDLEIIKRSAIDRELPHPLTLAVSLPKGDRQKFLVEKLVELGVTRLVPLETTRSVAEATPSALVRLRRQVIEASKQCGRNRLMEIAEPVTIEKLLQETPPSLRLVADPTGRPWRGNVTAAAALVAIGPEGGFTEQELNQAHAADWQVVALGSRILRIETTALAVAANFSLGMERKI